MRTLERVFWDGDAAAVAIVSAAAVLLAIVVVCLYVGSVLGEAWSRKKGRTL